MGFFSWLFGKKKKEAEGDGQEKFFTDEAKRAELTKQIKEKEPRETVNVDGKELERVPDGVAAKVREQAKARAEAEEAAAKTRIVGWSEETQALEVKADKPKPVRKRTVESRVEEQAPVSEPKGEIKNEDAADKADDGAKVLESKATRSGRFEVKQAKDGRYFFCLYASNHTVIAFSQIYSAAKSAMNGIRSVIANAAGAGVEDTTLKSPVTVPFPKWEIYIDKGGQYRFRLYATNGQCVCHSAHGYSTRATCKGGIESIIRFAGEANIEKVYLNKE